MSAKEDVRQEAQGEQAGTQQPEKAQGGQKGETQKAGQSKRAEAEPAEDEEQDAERYYEFRCNAIRQLKSDKEFYPYPHKFSVTHTLPALLAEFLPRSTERGKFSAETASIAGRVRAIRAAGKNLVFYDLSCDDGKLHKVQLMVNSALYGDAEHFARIRAIVKRGDVVGATGTVGLSKAGEFSLLPSRLELLSPCLHMLPKKHNELADVETRYRQRYLDLLVNSRPHEVFRTRARVIGTLRAELLRRDFLEVETPTLSVLAGGATAAPFVTHHSELDLQMYLRVAPELYLKRCIVGGIDRVFEIGKSFRNEGIDRTHNPEFTSVEIYWAYADYLDTMQLMEEVVCSIVLAVKGALRFSVRDGEREVEVDFARPWKRVNMLEELERVLGEAVPFPLESDATREFLLRACAARDIKCAPPQTTARLIDKLVGALIEPRLVNPTFLCEHPQLMSPLSKFHRSKPGLTERYEMFVNGREYINGYTELNDSFVQREMFEAQQRDRAQGDSEAQPLDEDFITALEYGLPPTSGVGLGVDRLVMLLTDSANIQDVILFPAMRPKGPA